MCVALPADDATLNLPIFDTVINGKTVIGSIVGTRNDLADVFALHAAGRTKVIAVDRKLDEVNESIDDVLAGRVPARIVFHLLAITAGTTKPVLPDRGPPPPRTRAAPHRWGIRTSAGKLEDARGGLGGAACTARGVEVDRRRRHAEGGIIGPNREGGPGVPRWRLRPGQAAAPDHGRAVELRRPASAGSRYRVALGVVWVVRRGRVGRVIDVARVIASTPTETADPGEQTRGPVSHQGVVDDVSPAAGRGHVLSSRSP